MLEIIVIGFSHKVLHSFHKNEFSSFSTEYCNLRLHSLEYSHFVILDLITFSKQAIQTTSVQKVLERLRHQSREKQILWGLDYRRSKIEIKFRKVQNSWCLSAAENAQSEVQ